MGKELELAIKIGGRLDKSLGSAVNNAQKQLNLISSVANKVGMAVTAGVVTAGVKLAVDSVNTYKDYQSALNSAAATAGIERGTAEYEAMNKAADEAGRTTIKTATEAANALEYMALAGWSVEDSTKALMPVLKLSASTGADLATTSDLVTDSMANLGLGINDLNHYLDVSATANNKSNQTAMQLQEAYLGVGGVLKNLNSPIEESAAVLGVLANRGTKGSEAGTALNAILVNMQKRSGDAYKAMSQLGVSMYDVNGDARSIIDVFQEISDKTSGMTEENRNLMYQMIGGKSHLDSFAKIMQGFTTDTADGTKEVYSLMNAFQNCDGALDKLYGIKTNTLEGSIELLKSSYDGMLRNIGKQIEPTISIAAKDLTKKMPQIEQIITQSLEKIIPAMSKILDYVVNNSDNIISGAIEIAKAFTMFKISSGAIKGINSVIELIKNLSMLKNTVGGAKVLQGLIGTFTGVGTVAETFGGAVTSGIATLLSIFAPIAGVAAAVTAPFAATVSAAAIASKAIENYKQGLLDSAQAAANAANGAIDVSKQTQILSEYYNKWQELNNLRSNGQSLVEDEIALQEVEQWFIDNYAQFVSTWEQKNGVLASTVEYVKEYQEALNAAKYAELESSVTEAQSKVPEIQKEIAYTEQLLEAQKTQALQSLQMQGELQTFQNKMNGLNSVHERGGMNSEQYRQQRQDLISQNQELLSSYEKLIGIPVDMGNISGAIDNLKNKNSELNELANSNSKQLEAYQQALSQYGEAAKSMVEMDFGMSFVEAISQGSDKLPIMEKQLTGIMQTMQLIPEYKEVHIAADGSIEITDKQLSALEQEYLDMEVNGRITVNNIDTTSAEQKISAVSQQSTENLDNTINIQKNATVNAGNIDTTLFANSLFAILDGNMFPTTAREQIVTVNPTIQAGIVNAEPAKESIFSETHGLFNNLPETKTINLNANANDNASPTIQNLQKLTNIFAATDAKAQLSATDNASSKISSVSNLLSNLNGKTAKTTIITEYKIKGTLPANNARGTESWRGGLTYVNDQRISDPREVIEHNGMRYWYEGKNILANIPRGARIYNAAESRAFINGSHRNGLARVPFDGYIAELHAGEQVLTADEASDYQENSMLAQAVERLMEHISIKNNQKSSGDSNDNGSQINFSPNITINGNADKETVISAMRISAREFKEMFERMIRDDRRKSF